MLEDTARSGNMADTSKAPLCGPPSASLQASLAGKKRPAASIWELDVPGLLEAGSPIDSSKNASDEGGSASNASSESASPERLNETPGAERGQLTQLPSSAAIFSEDFHKLPRVGKQNSIPTLPRFQSMVTENHWQMVDTQRSHAESPQGGQHIQPAPSMSSRPILYQSPTSRPLGPPALKYPEEPLSTSAGPVTPITPVASAPLQASPASHGNVRRPRRYSHRVPSKYCHICQRKSDAVNHVVCKNIVTGVCRKAVCEVCFEDYGWNWHAATTSEAGWSCPHCEGICPTRAQCYTYMKTNHRRRAGELSRRPRKSKVENTSVCLSDGTSDSPSGSPVSATISTPRIPLSFSPVSPVQQSMSGCPPPLNIDTFPPTPF